MRTAPCSCSRAMARSSAVMALRTHTASVRPARSDSAVTSPPAPRRVTRRPSLSSMCSTGPRFETSTRPRSGSASSLPSVSAMRASNLPTPGTAHPPRSASPAVTALLHAFADDLASLLEVAVGDGLDLGGQAHRRLHTREVELDLPGVDADVAGDPVPVVGGEVGGDGGYLGEQVDVGGERGHGPVQEEQVLHEEHQLLGHASPVGEEGLGELADLPYELVGRHGRGVLGRAVEPEVADHAVEVGAPGEGPQL